MDKEEIKLILTLVVIGYLIIMNTVGLIVMKVDKVKAQKQVRRIKEATLFLISAIGGSLGTWAGMYLFRHKTKHWYFVVGMPFIFLVHIVILYLLFSKGILSI